MPLVRPGDSRRTAFHVPAFPGDPPCGLSLSVGHDGRFVLLSIIEADLRLSGTRGPGTMATPTLRYDPTQDIAELVFQDEPSPDRIVPFDWPEDAPRWNTQAELDSSGRLIRVVVHEASRKCRMDILQAATDSLNP